MKKQHLYEAITAYLRGEIMDGRYAVGDMIPSENELAARFATSRVTVRKSLQIKTEDGWRELEWGNCYLPTQIGFEVPYGLDARFPDMRYNYDGRNSAVKEPE